MGFTSFNSKTTNGDRAAEQAQADRAERRANARSLPAQPTIFHESYGDVTRPQLAAYRKHNVSPSDHNDLADEFGEDDHRGITQVVKDRSPKGYYNAPWPGHQAY